MADAPRGLEIAAALRLAAWLSPSFPIGAFSYSHGIERAVELGCVHDEPSLRRFVEGVLLHGSARSDAILFACAWRAATSEAAFAEIARLAAALRPSAELAREAEAQGEAFLRTALGAWPAPGLTRIARWLEDAECPPVLAAVVGGACRAHSLPLHASLALYLHAFAANLVSAGIRLVPLGQMTGQRITAALEPAVSQRAELAAEAELEELGNAGPMVEILSMQHEEQYTRLFRS
jgi:urease accessory protein